VVDEVDEFDVLALDVKTGFLPCLPDQAGDGALLLAVAGQDVSGGGRERGVGVAQPEQYRPVGPLQVEVDADDVEERAVRRSWAALLVR
jgi:hypothetical protein